MSNQDIIEHQNNWIKIQKNWKNNHTRLYHLSSVVNRENILKNGLLPHSVNGPVIFYSDRICLLTNKNRLFEIQEITGKHTCAMDLWEIDNSNLDLNLILDEYAKNSRCCYVTTPILVDKIKLIKTIKPLIS